ncbi:hypothetical protein D3C80_2013750 [compost metagenome]
MLNIHCSDDRNAVFQKTDNILITLTVRTAGHIGMSQLIHQHNFGVAGDNCFGIHFFQLS